MSRGDEPAYPVMTEDHYNMHPGMTIREAFAKAAMQGFIANPDLHIDKDQFVEIALGSIRHADALLAELEATNAKQSD